MARRKLFSRLLLILSGIIVLTVVRWYLALVYDQTSEEPTRFLIMLAQFYIMIVVFLAGAFIVKFKVLK